MTDGYFLGNLALTGQFDSGSAGGAVLMEDCADSQIGNTIFHENGAAGYTGYSSYASSGSAGAVMLKFSSVTITYTQFLHNWASVGGTRQSNGGALAIYFDYTVNGNDISDGVRCVRQTSDVKMLIVDLDM